ncbi:Cytochrome C oxidase, cbb3-type, subunit III [Nitrosomonas sp. Nm51]|uniref:c-type cytochrome n=1 Tax=Nitrosomonas sp. Nm51 TaxID=133720 RepID=UPI0008D2427E|nr:cytochrome c [Nitrosomonas sp. Nm51]SER27589.1 Cytochrome C oxidase, cbb3-type, subunit III [Nitrosomonas sp. Nm51]
MKAIFGLLLAALIAAAYIMGTGVYNMAATDKHWPVTEKLIEWMRINSIAARANQLTVPAMDEAEFMVTGALHYDAMCADCHLAPGQEPTELSQGLYPQAPAFHVRPALTSPEDLQKQSKAYFWVIKNGIKMTAMPAWGLTHDDDIIWAMAFFVQRLSDMPVSQYIELTHVEDDHPHTHEHEHEHEHEHNHIRHETHDIKDSVHDGMH